MRKVYGLKHILFIIVFVFSYLPLPAVSCRAEGGVESLRDFHYWDNGKTKGCTVYDANGRMKAKLFYREDGTTEKIEKYDLNGNKTEEAWYDQKGRLKAGIDGWAAMRWRYYGAQLVSQISYGEDGIPLERKQYSEGGSLIFRQYRESLDDEAPYEGANMAYLLGGRNIPYYDSSKSVYDPMPVVQE